MTFPTLPINGSRLMADLRELAEIGRFQTGVDRVAFSKEDIKARRWLMGKLGAAGFEAGIDRVGNVLGVYPGVKQSILVGSHTDTVPKGGWLDGALGVIYALEIARAARESDGTSRVGVDVISFQDEEGTYFPLLGSRAFCSDVKDADLAAAKSKDGTLLSAAMAPLSGERPPMLLEKTRHLCFIEAHIEQGPRLETAGRRIGVVTGIVGIRRFQIRAEGRADHAGTTPMAMRQDAGMALMRLAIEITEFLTKSGTSETVWNIGNFVLRPGSANVVPGEAEMTLEFRDTDTAVLDRLEREVLALVGRHKEIEARGTARIAPTMMSRAMGEAIAAAAKDRGEDAAFMPSGAGHDAMLLGRFVPAAMMFIPSIGGRSHHISENTSDADIIFGCEVMGAAVERLRQQPPAN
jgi:N-carbamoyl-L-amino-acid hydrolase